MAYLNMYLNLKPHMSSWRVYNQNGPYTTAYAIGSLAPAQFGGLSYRIREEKGNDVYVISTESFGLCAIWAPRDADSTITSSPAYSNGDVSIPTTPLSEMNSKGFANKLGMKFSATGQTLVIFSSGAITIKLRNSLSTTSDGQVVANVSNGVLTSGTYKTELQNLMLNLDNAGYGVSAHLAKINGLNFSVAVTSNTTTTTTITLTTSTPITSYGSANQSIIIELNQPALETAYATNSISSLANSIRQVSTVLCDILVFVLTVIIKLLIVSVAVLVIISIVKGAALLSFILLL